MFKNRGFTLVELLVVISIIAILSIVGIVSYTNFLKSSRDAKRQSDLKLIQSALEDYHADLLVYPKVSGGLVLSSTVTLDSDIGRGSIQAPATKKTYLNNIPKDLIPSPYPAYCYRSTLSNGSDCDNSDSSSDHRCAKYTLYAKLENLPSGSNSCGNDSTYNFQVTPP